MSRITDLFERLKRERRKALIPFLMAGYPDMGTSGELVLEAIEAGADLVEIGMPFSDPLADGPVIQEASQVALAGGMNLQRLLKIVRGLRTHTQTPLVLLTYLNPVLQYGLRPFLRDATIAGLDGMVVPDLTHEAGHRYHDMFDDAEIDLVPLLAPTSPQERVRKITARARGFVYLVSLTGVTGARKDLPPELGQFVRRVREETTKPLCVGFGISGPEQAREVSRLADGVIVGSALVRRIGQATGPDAISAEVRRFLRDLRGAIDR